MKNTVILFLLSALLAADSSLAQSVWTGNAGNASWSEAGNWQGGVAPVPSPLTSLTFGGGVTDAQNDFISGSVFSNLTFAAGASGFGLSGNGFSLYGTLINSSSVQQRIANDLIWSGSKRTLDTGAGGIALDGYLSSAVTNASFIKNGSGVLTLNGGGNVIANDGDTSKNSQVNAGTLVITKDIIFNRLDVQNNARVIVTNNATWSGFTGGSYSGFWQASTIDLYSGRINVAGASLLVAQDWTKTCTVNVRGGVFVGSSLRWANNGNVVLSLSGDGEFQWLAGSALSENGGGSIAMNGGLFRRGSNGSDDFNVGHGTVKKSAGTIANRIDFNAGVFLAGALVNGAITNLHTTLLFNGGSIRAGKATTAFFGARPDLIDSTVGAGGLVFDTQGYAVTLNDALEAGGGSDGGLTKLGTGTLTLSTNCTYTGATTVSNGLLRIDAPLASSALRLAPYASATLANAAAFAGTLAVEQGATFAFTTNATTSLALAGLTTGSAQGAGKIAFEITDAANLDQIAVSGTLDLSQGGAALLYQPGTTTRFAANGAYTLITYSGSLIGSADSLRVANPNPAKLYQFSAADGVLTLTIADGTAAQWTSATDGIWSESANWSGGVPNAVGAAAQFLSAAAAPLTVTLDAPATVGGLIFDNAAAPYTLAGGATLTLDADTQQAALLVQTGTHTVAMPLALAGASLAQPEAGTSLTLAGDLSGVGPLTVTGAGSVSLTGTNHAQTQVLDGTLSINDGASLAGGILLDNGTLAVTANTAIDTGFEIGARDAFAQPATGVTLSLAASATGEGTLRKTGAGTLALAASLANAGGTLVSAGTLDFANDVFGTTPLKLGGGTVRFVGPAPVTLGAPVTVSASSVLRTEQAPLTLSGALGFSAAATLSLESTHGMTFAGTANIPDAGRKVQLREGSLTLASGADYALSSGARDTVQLGRDANRPTELVIEAGARLKTGGIHMNTTDAAATNCASIVRQEGGVVEVTHSDGLFIRDYGLSDATYLMNGGTFVAPASSWANIGSKGRGFLTINGGTMSLGRLSMGVTDNSTYAYNGPGGHLAVGGGRLTVAGSCSWMSDAYAARYNTVVLGNGTPGQGQLDLVATTRSVPYANGGGRTAFTFNGGLLKTLGLAPYGTSTLTNYLYGVDTLTLRSGGARIETPGADITIAQPLRASDMAGGLVKRGMATLTLPATNNAWCGLTDVQAGTLRARLNQNEQRLYPEGLLALWTFDDGTSADQSGNGFHLSQQNDTNLVSFVDGGSCGKAALFTGLSSLKMPYSAAFNTASYSVSLWANLGVKNGTHQGFFSTRVDTGETSANGTFDFKFNNGNFISSFNPLSEGNGVMISAAMGGNLDTGTWHMVTYVVRPGQIDAYLDGAWKNGTNVASTLTPYLLTPGHILTIGRGHSSTTEPVREMLAAGGRIDDVAIFARALSSDEVAVIYETTLPRPPVRVAAAATFDLLGTTNTTPSVTGGGTVSNGVLCVTDRLSPEAEGGPALLTIERLSLGSTNLTYACTVTGQTNDLVRVTGALVVTASGTVDLGRTALEPLTTPFRRTIMTYGTLEPADALTLAQWKVTGDGITGRSVRRSVVVDSANKRVDVEIRLVGTLLFVF